MPRSSRPCGRCCRRRTGSPPTTSDAGAGRPASLETAGTGLWSALAVVHADGFGVDLDLDALADHEAAGLERLVPGDVEVLAVDLGGREEPGSDLAPRVRVHTA